MQDPYGGYHRPRPARYGEPRPHPTGTVLAPEWGKAAGVMAVVTGILILLGPLSVPWIKPLVGATLVLAGILVLTGVMRDTVTVGVFAMVLGTLMFVDVFALPEGVSVLFEVVVGSGLIVFGTLRLSG